MHQHMNMTYNQYDNSFSKEKIILTNQEKKIGFTIKNFIGSLCNEKLFDQNRPSSFVKK